MGHISCSSMAEVVKIISHNSLGKSLINEKDELVVQELGITFQKTLAVQGPCEQSCGHGPSSGENEVCNPEETRISCNFCQSLPLRERNPIVLNKSATFPCSEVVRSYSSSTNERQGSLCTMALGQNSSKSESTVYTHSVSMPTSFKLVSAMRGGREQNGTSLNMKLHVKWAPEVYDPPTTSMSHTVKSHQQCYKAKKKDFHRHRQNKGKSSPRSGGEKKYAAQRSSGNMINSPELRAQATGGKLVLDDCGKPTLEIFSYAAGHQEAKCRSSFLRDSLGKVNLSMGEAS